MITYAIGTIFLIMTVTFSQLCESILPEIPTRVLWALAQVESSGEGFQDNRIKIRFETHLFLSMVPEANDKFRVGSPLWLEHEFLLEGVWTDVHQSQTTEYKALELASSISAFHAYQVLSIGAFQINTSNYVQLGFPRPFPSLMMAFAGESDERYCQVAKKYIESIPDLHTAFVNEDLATIASYWNNDNQLWLDRLRLAYFSYDFGS